MTITRRAEIDDLEQRTFSRDKQKHGFRSESGEYKYSQFSKTARNSDQTQVSHSHKPNSMRFYDTAQKSAQLC